jgi:hypothetical protein
MRRLILVAIICLVSTPAFACVFDTDCKPGSTCLDGVCSGALHSGDDNNNVPMKRATGKSCFDDSDCSQGSRCIKGSGTEGVCIGH